MGKECNLPKPKARHVLQYFQGRGYAIVDPAGRVISGFDYDSALLEARLERLQAEHDERMKRGPRPCMCCGHSFRSEGIHNRMCDDCRHRDVAPDPLKGRARERRVA